MPPRSPSPDVFSALASPARRRILDMLAEQDRAVTEIARRFRVSQPAISQHLRVLSDAGLVQSRQIGRRRLYSLLPDALKAPHDWLSHYERFWTDRLSAIGDVLDEESRRSTRP